MWVAAPRTQTTQFLAMCSNVAGFLEIMQPFLGIGYSATHFRSDNYQPPSSGFTRLCRRNVSIAS